jgi:sugar phosphate isomerase/epimerase
MDENELGEQPGELAPEEVAQIRRRRKLIDELTADYNAAIQECVPEYHGHLSNCIAEFLIDKGWAKTTRDCGQFAELRADYKLAIEQCVPAYPGGMSRCIAKILISDGWNKPA